MLSTFALLQKLNLGFSLLLLYFLHWVVRCFWSMGGLWVNDPSNDVPTDTSQPVKHEGQLIEHFVEFILRCKYSLSSSKSDWVLCRLDAIKYTWKEMAVINPANFPGIVVQHQIWPTAIFVLSRLKLLQSVPMPDDKKRRWNF